MGSAKRGPETSINTIDIGRVAKWPNAGDCKSFIREFDSHHALHSPLAQLVRAFR